MKKMIWMFLAVLALAVPVTLTAPPAQAAANMWHYSPDEGFDDHFIVEYPNGTIGPLYEGQTGYISRIYIGSGNRVVCTNNGGGSWYVAFDATGWHNVYAGMNYNNGCVHQRD